MKKINSVAIGGWTSSAYLLACREPVKSLADLKGKRVRATGGSAEMFRIAGAVPVGATLVEAVSLLQRGGLDCQHGIADWLRTFGYADFAKNVTDIPLGLTGPAIGFLMNRDTWQKFTPEQKKVHIKYASWLSAKMAIGNFLIANEEGLAAVIRIRACKCSSPIPTLRRSGPSTRRLSAIATSRWRPNSA
jgi:TRAP-type C4-dicarboxylate transport system substrate-binding protein